LKIPAGCSVLTGNAGLIVLGVAGWQPRIHVPRGVYHVMVDPRMEGGV
jgi:hypothetical protein